MYDKELIRAVLQGNARDVALCLRRGANPNACDGDHHTALTWACSDQSAEVIRLLLQEGADPNLPNGRGMAFQLSVARPNRRRQSAA